MFDAIVGSMIDDLLDRFHLEREQVAQFFQKLQVELPVFLQTARERLIQMEAGIARLEEHMGTTPNAQIKPPFEELKDRVEQLVQRVEQGPLMGELSTALQTLRAEFVQEIGKLKADFPSAEEIKDRLTKIENAIAGLIEVNRNGPRGTAVTDAPSGGNPASPDSGTPGAGAGA